MKKDVGMPEDLKKKFDAIKVKLEKFKKEVLKKHNKDIAGIALLPPKKDDENKINVLVLVDDSKYEKPEEKYDLKKKLMDSLKKVGESVDKNISVNIMCLWELKEDCYDGKYEILNMVAMGAHLHDPMDILGAIKISEVHKTMVLKKFDKYITSYVVAGSLFRNEKSHDIDVYVVIDDTDVKRMSRVELKDKLRAIIIGQGFEAARLTGVQKQFHVQTYILTDFWDNLKDANPVIFTLLRDGVPLYDRGVFMPWKLLLQMGRIRPSPEAIDMQMNIGEKLIERTKHKMLGIVAEDLYYSILNPAQAALMLYGLNPPTHRETISLLREVFVKKEKILEEEYVKILENIFKYFKDIEHGKIKEVKGKDIDKLLEDSKKYLNRIQKLFTQLDKKKEKENISNLYETCLNVSIDLFKIYGLKGSLENNFKTLVTRGEIPKKYYDVFKKILKLKSQKLTRAEVQKVRREASMFVKTLVEFIQRKRGVELERTKIRVKYGGNYGEIYLLDDVAFIIDNIDAKDKEVNKAKLMNDGSLKDVKKSSMLEFERHISDLKIPEKVFIKEKIFENLKKIFGKDVEILVSY